MLLSFQTIQILSVLFTLIKGICNHVGYIPMDTCFYKSSELSMKSMDRKCLNATHWVEEAYATSNCSGQATYSAIHPCEKYNVWSCNCNTPAVDCKIATTTITSETVDGINWWASADIIIDECFIDKHALTSVSSYKVSCVNNKNYENITMQSVPIYNIYYYMNSSNCTGESIDLYASKSVAWNCSAQIPDNENNENCTHFGGYATDYWRNTSTSFVYDAPKIHSFKQVCVDDYHYKDISVDDVIGYSEYDPVICDISDGCNCKGSIKNCHLATYEETSYRDCPHIQYHSTEVYVLNICVNVSDDPMLWGGNGSQKTVCSEDNGIKTIYYTDTHCMDELKYSVRVDGCGALVDSFATTEKTVTTTVSTSDSLTTTENTVTTTVSTSDSLTATVSSSNSLTTYNTVTKMVSDSLTTMISSSDTLALRTNKQDHRIVNTIVIISVSIGVIVCVILILIKLIHRKHKLYMVMMTNETDENKEIELLPQI